MTSVHSVQLYQALCSKKASQTIPCYFNVGRGTRKHHRAARLPLLHCYLQLPQNHFLLLLFFWYWISTGICTQAKTWWNTIAKHGFSEYVVSLGQVAVWKPEAQTPSTYRQRWISAIRAIWVPYNTKEYKKAQKRLNASKLLTDTETI